MTTPTVGMLLKFQPTQFPDDPAPPLLDAEVMHVNGATSVDLEITAGNGTLYLQNNVKLLQIGDPGLPGGFFARMTS